MIPPHRFKNIELYKTFKRWGFRYCKHPDCTKVYSLSDWYGWSGFCYEHHIGKVFK